MEQALVPEGALELELVPEGALELELVTEGARGLIDYVNAPKHLLLI